MTTIKPPSEATERARAIATRTEAIFRGAGAMREGHVLLASGRHGDAFVEASAVLADPQATIELCGFWAAEHLGPGVGNTTIDLVAGPTIDGAILAAETGRQLGTPALVAEEIRGADGTTRRELRRGPGIEPGERVLLVDGILTTGGSLLETIRALEAVGGDIVECHVLVDSGGAHRQTLTSSTSGRTYPLRSLWQLDLHTYAPGPATCPPCAAGAPLEAPGSSGAGTA